ncbi:MAG TPA: AfsR/SARP family transcriptional regulator, partial [Acidimicrobiales bacterium]
MARSAQVSVLGPVRLLLDGQDRTPGGALQRRLLCALALQGAGSPGGDLAGLMWPEGLPTDHRAALQTHVFRLRRLLPEGAISTTTGGAYRLDLGTDALDATRFEAVVYAAAALRAQDPEAAAARLDEALGWWRGTPYDELAEVDDARIEAARLAELGLRAREERFDCLLDLGRHQEALADLEAFAAHEPLRERPQALLMVALHRSGRRADALATYDRFRRGLAADLGIDPSAGLRDLHDAIVTDEVRAPAAPPPSRAAAGSVPRFGSRLIGRDPLLVEVV